MHFDSCSSIEGGQSAAAGCNDCPDSERINHQIFAFRGYVKDGRVKGFEIEHQLKNLTFSATNSTKELYDIKDD